MPRVLIIKPSSLGDIVHGLQVAQSLHKQWPEATIDWVVSPAFAPLVRACPAIDQVFIFPRNGSPRDFIKLAAALRQQRYEWALDFQGLARSALLLAAVRAKHKAGRADSREGAGWLYRKKPALPEDGYDAHALEILLQFLPLLGLKPELAGPLEFRPPQTDFFPPGLLECGPVVIFPDTRRPEKMWGGYLELTDRLLFERPELTVVWAGATGPEPELIWPEDQFFNLLGRTPLEALPALLASARLVIGNDSGPMHLAAALERPTVALFGPTDPNRFGPYPLESRQHYIVRAHGGDLRRLEPDYVWEVVAAITLPPPV